MLKYLSKQLVLLLLVLYITLKVLQHLPQTFITALPYYTLITVETMPLNYVNIPISKWQNSLPGSSVIRNIFSTSAFSSASSLTRLDGSSIFSAVGSLPSEHKIVTVNL